MANQGYNVPIADPNLALRQTEPTSTTEKQYELSEEENKEKEEVEEIMDARKRYGEQRKGKEREWTESYKMYMSWVDRTLNPYMSNLFIPKTHEAVELLCAFLIGNNQSISASPEGGNADYKKARVAGKWLDFLWRKILKARINILVFVKQGCVFGNGIMKVGWDNEKTQPWMNPCAIEDVYFDYFESNIQDSEYIIHELRRTADDVRNNETYNLVDVQGNLIRNQVITGGPNTAMETSALFNAYDTSLKSPECDGKVLVVEAWCKKDNKLITLLPTTMGWRAARRVDNPNHYNDPEQTPFRPFVKLRFKVSPVPNRAYDMSAVYPTIKIQKAFNDLVNEYFDNVVLVNNKMWIKRRGARINPLELVRRPGGIITTGDIDKDLKTEEVSDVKSSIVEMLNRLDNEFQQASMVVNLLKGVSDAKFATEVATGQENVQTLLDMIDGNISDALSELGQMILSVSVNNTEGVRELILYETDSEVGKLEFEPKKLDSIFDIKIVPDRTSSTSKAVLAKQIIDFLNIISRDQITLQRFPNLPMKVYKRWLDYQGIGDPDSFFEEEAPQAMPSPLNGMMPDQLPLPARNALNTPQAIQQSTSVV